VTGAPSPLRELVDSRVGVILSCGRVPKDWREPPLPIVAAARLSNFDHRRVPQLDRWTSGKGLTEWEAERGAIVEALERYCALQRGPGALVRGRASTLDAATIPPTDFVLYSERQYDSLGFRYHRPEDDEELTWTRGTLLGSGEPVYAPASLVYMGFGGHGGREFFTPMNTSGLAGGANLDSAVLAGIYELVERDAFVNTWLGRMPAPRIDFAAAPGLSSRIRWQYERFGVELLAFDLTVDLGIPAVMALALDKLGRLPAASVGLGCDVNPVLALDRAVMEIVQVRSGLLPRFRQEQPPPPIDRHDEVRTLEDHAAWAANPDRLFEFDFLLRSGSVRRLADLVDLDRGSVDANLRLCRERLEAAGCTVAYVDLTTPDLEQLPVRIVRAIATGLQPIHFGFREERLGGERPFRLPRLLGHTARDLVEEDLNPCPHPLA
jgi:ribosomal protein S12 methylthiotransferase accessory factor